MQKTDRVLLLNLPGRSNYNRCYYCSASTKSSYLFQPLDLMMLSGRLEQAGFPIVVYDGMTEKKSVTQIAKLIRNNDIKWIICLTGMVSWEEDKLYLRTIKEDNRAVRIIATGDVFFEKAKEIIQKEDYLDAVLFDFTSLGVVHYLKGDYANIRDMTFRKDGQIIEKRDSPGKAESSFALPVPKHGDFIHKKYRFPFVKHYPFTSVITSFGCPFKCAFCIGSILPFKYRTVTNIMEELKYIRHNLGIKEIFFFDLTFGLPRANIIELCRQMIEMNFGFSWTCYSRVDVLDREMLALFKKAGCHTIMFGVESANDVILKKYNKGFQTKQVKETFMACSKLGLHTVATFILGFPEETYEDCLATIKFSKEIDCDYASFNIAAPRPGTALREKALGERLIDPEDISFDHSGNAAIMKTKFLGENEIRALKKRAVKEFYLRPSYLIKRIRGISTWVELKEHLGEAYGLLKGMIVDEYKV